MRLANAEILFWVLLLTETISLLCMVSLWRRRDARLRSRVLWSVVLFVPLLGPLLYGSLFRPLPAHGERKPWPQDRGGLPPGGYSG